MTLFSCHTMIFYVGFRRSTFILLSDFEVFLLLGCVKPDIILKKSLIETKIPLGFDFPQKETCWKPVI